MISNINNKNNIASTEYPVVKHNNQYKHIKFIKINLLSEKYPIICKVVTIDPMIDLDWVITPLYQVPFPYTTSSIRNVVYNMNHSISTCIERRNISNHKYIENICLSSVFIFRNTPFQNGLSYKEKLLFAFAELSDNHEYLLIDFYLTTFNDIKNKTFELYKPIQINENDNKFILLLDLDKTLIIVDQDVTEIDAPHFIPHININGYTAINDKPFTHNIMIRPNCHKFLIEASKVSEIYIVTASDLHYAREIINNLNSCNWLPSNEKYIQDIIIPIKNVFSVRNQYEKHIPKSFKQIIPYFLLEEIKHSIICKAIDDNIHVWDKNELESKDNILQIEPFSPINKNDNELLKTLSKITNLNYLEIDDLDINYIEIDDLDKYKVIVNIK